MKVGLMEEDSFTITVTIAELSGVPYLAFIGDGGGGAPGAACTLFPSACGITHAEHGNILHEALPGQAPRTTSSAQNAATQYKWQALQLQNTVPLSEVENGLFLHSVAYQSCL